MKSTFKALFLSLTMALFVLPAVSDGVTDNTNIFQKLLNRLGDLGGGTLYVPTRKYVIKGNLTIPKGVNFTMYYHFYVLQKKHTPPRNIQIPTQCMLL